MMTLGVLASVDALNHPLVSITHASIQFATANRAQFRTKPPVTSKALDLGGLSSNASRFVR